MKAGKLSELILSRSVLKKIRHKRSEVLQGARAGFDAAVFATGKELVTAVEMSTSMTFLGELPRTRECLLQVALLNARLTAIKAANSVAAEGGEPFAMMPAITLPEGFREQGLKKIMDCFEEVAEELDVQIAGGHTEVSSEVNSPVFAVTVFGQRESGCCVEWKKEKCAKTPGQDIVMTKSAALEGTACMAILHAEQLEKRFIKGYLQPALDAVNELSVLAEAKIACEHNATCMHDLSETGVFGGLWELGEKLGVGVEVGLKEIPIRQETVELSEYLDMNPYTMPSAGGMLIVTADGGQMVQALEAAGIPAVVIGCITEGKDKVLLNDTERRYLEQPR